MVILNTIKEDGKVILITQGAEIQGPIEWTVITTEIDNFIVHKPCNCGVYAFNKNHVVAPTLLTRALAGTKRFTTHAQQKRSERLLTFS